MKCSYLLRTILLPIGSVLFSGFLINGAYAVQNDQWISEGERQFAALNRGHSFQCMPTVVVNYVDQGYVVEHVGNPDSAISVKSSLGRVAGFAQYRGISSQVSTRGSGCQRQIFVTVTWNAPVIIVMPHKSQVGACRYNRVLHHEMEHARVYLRVPRDFEDQIARAAATSVTPQQAVRGLHHSITNEIIRRNKEFHAFEARLPPVKGC